MRLCTSKAYLFVCRMVAISMSNWLPENSGFQHTSNRMVSAPSCLIVIVAWIYLQSISVQLNCEKSWQLTRKLFFSHSRHHLSSAADPSPVRPACTNKSFHILTDHDLQRELVSRLHRGCASKPPPDSAPLAQLARLAQRVDQNQSLLAARRTLAYRLIGPNNSLDEQAFVSWLNSATL